MKRKIVLFSSLFMLLQVIVFAQSKTVKGTIKDSKTSETLPGATILVEGTTTATATDINGAFSINVEGEGKKLVISAVGYVTQIVAADKDELNIVLAADVKQLEVMVVTANALTRQQRSLPNSTAVVGNEELTQGQNTSALAALQGKVSGLNITSGTGGPTSATRVVLRGGSSFGGNNQPLIVVDGVPIDNSSFRSPDRNGVSDDMNNQVDYGNRGNDINPEDIESVSILKGPGAAALYGARASNGAIVYTTKSGKNKKGGEAGNRKVDITLNSSTTFSTVLKLPDFQNEYGQGNIYAGQSPDDRRENFSWGYKFDGKDRPWGQIINGQQQNKKYEAIPNNARDYFNTGVTYNNTLGITGGNEKSTFYLSLNAVKGKGIVPNTESNKYNVRYNGTTELSNNFSATYSANYTNNVYQLPAGGQQNSSVMSALIQTPRDIPIIDGKDLTNPFNGYDDVAGKYGFYGAYALNPYFVNEAFKNENKVNRILGNVSLKYQNDKFKWFSIIDRLGGDIFSERHEQRWKKYNYEPYEAFYAGNVQTYAGKFQQDIFSFSEITNDLMINLDKQINEKIRLYGTIGQNYRQTSSDQTSAQTNAQGGLAISDYYNLENSNGPAATFSKISLKRQVGLYADANFAFKNMLFLNATARNDWSSTLPASKRSFFYPSGGVSFVYSELFGEELKKKISYAKLRGSIAQVGNDANPYLEKTVFNKGNLSGGAWGSTTLPFNDMIGYSVGNVIGNSAIRPEITTAIEVGTEMNFYKDRIGVDIGLYKKTSKDQIITLPLAPSTGYTGKIVNAGTIENKGIEILLRGTPILTKEWKVELIGTFTKNVNEVIELAEGVEQIGIGGSAAMAIVATPGKPYGTFYGRDYKRDGQGNVVVDDKGLPIVASSPSYYGTYNPDYQASIRGNVSYKSLTFGILFDGKKGGQFYSNTRSLASFVGTSAETAEGGRDPRVWENSVVETSPGVYVPNTKAYRPYDFYSNQANVAPSNLLVDASYIKLREVSLSYRLPTKIFDKTPLGGISIGVFGNNLFLWTPKENQFADPEINASGNGNTQGFEFSSLPSQRNFGFNIKVNF